MGWGSLFPGPITPVQKIISGEACTAGVEAIETHSLQEEIKATSAAALTSQWNCGKNKVGRCWSVCYRVCRRRGGGAVCVCSGGLNGKEQYPSHTLGILIVKARIYFSTLLNSNLQPAAFPSTPNISAAVIQEAALHVTLQRLSGGQNDMKIIFLINLANFKLGH